MARDEAEVFEAVASRRATGAPMFVSRPHAFQALSAGHDDARTGAKVGLCSRQLQFCSACPFQHPPLTLSAI